MSTYTYITPTLTGRDKENAKSDVKSDPQPAAAPVQETADLSPDG